MYTKTTIILPTLLSLSSMIAATPVARSDMPSAQGLNPGDEIDYPSYDTPSTTYCTTDALAPLKADAQELADSFTGDETYSAATPDKCTVLREEKSARVAICVQKGRDESKPKVEFTADEVHDALETMIGSTGQAKTPCYSPDGNTEHIGGLGALKTVRAPTTYDGSPSYRLLLENPSSPPFEGPQSRGDV